MRIICLFFAIVVAFVSFACCAEEEKDFLLSAEQIEGIENGPVVIKVTLSYGGKSPYVFTASNCWPRDSIVIKAPDSWISRRENKLSVELFSKIIGERIIRTNEKIVAYVFAHHDYVKIPKGNVTVEINLNSLKFTETLFNSTKPQEKNNMKPIHISTKLDLKVAAAEKDTLDNICIKISEILDKTPTIEKEQYVEDLVIWTPHKLFLPICFRLMQSKGVNRRHYALRQYLYEISRERKNVHTELIEFMKMHGSFNDRMFYDSWRRDKIDLTKEDVKQLLESDDVWIRALTYRNYPTKCPPGLKGSIENELKQLQKILDGVNIEKQTRNESSSENKHDGKTEF